MLQPLGQKKNIPPRSPVSMLKGLRQGALQIRLSKKKKPTASATLSVGAGGGPLYDLHGVFVKVLQHFVLHQYSGTSCLQDSYM